MASMEKRDAVDFVMGIIESHVDQATDEEVKNLAEEIVDRMENIEIYDKGDIDDPHMDRPQVDDEEYEE